MHFVRTPRLFSLGVSLRNSFWFEKQFKFFRPHCGGLKDVLSIRLDSDKVLKRNIKHIPQREHLITQRLQIDSPVLVRLLSFDEISGNVLPFSLTRSPCRSKAFLRLSCSSDLPLIDPQSISVLKI